MLATSRLRKNLRGKRRNPAWSGTFQGDARHSDEWRSFHFGLEGAPSVNSTTGVISGTPTSGGSRTFTITATNATAPDVSTILTIAASGPVLAETGVDAAVPLVLGSALLASGALLMMLRRRPQRRH